jgi:hypothetical protein
MVVTHLVHAVTSPRFAWLHFALIGGVLYGAQSWLSGQYAAEAATPTRVERARLSDEELLYREALRRGLDRRDAVVRRRLVQNMRFLGSLGIPELEAQAGLEPSQPARGQGGDETLYREALALGLDRSDRVVRRRLVETMRQVLIAESERPLPDDAALKAHLLANRERFEQPARRRIDQLYYATEQRARQALAKLAKSGGDGEAELVSIVSAAPSVVSTATDPLPIPRALPPLSRRELAARLGDGFARKVFTLSEGRWWGPIESSYGAHWVRVREHVPARLPDVAEVRGALTRRWIADRDERALTQALAALRGE